VTYKSMPLMCDNSSAICLAQNSVFHERVKHIKVRHHFLRDHVEKGDIVIKYIDTERQLVDIFTKPLDASHVAALQGGTWCLPSLWLGLRGSLCFILYILFFSSYLPKLSFASPVILVCIWLTMVVIMLG
jgi:hypothetical protein